MCTGVILLELSGAENTCWSNYSKDTVTGAENIYGYNYFKASGSLEW